VQPNRRESKDVEETWQIALRIGKGGSERAGKGVLNLTILEKGAVKPPAGGGGKKKVGRKKGR